MSWPVNSQFASVGLVIPEWPRWSPEELEQLRLTEGEHEAYIVTHADGSRFLTLTEPAPTFLHSYGNATTSCPCKCRCRSFSHERLTRDGLRGVLVLDHLGEPRFLHPREVAFLLSFPAGFPIMTKLRATLCLLGQSAAPLQSLWVFLHLKQILFEDVDRDFMDFIRDFQTQLLFAKYHLWPVPSACEDCEVSLDTSDDVPLVLRKKGLCPVTNLLTAETCNVDWGQQIFLLDGCVRVPTSALLRDQGFYGPYKLVRTMKHQASVATSGILVLALKGVDFDFFQTAMSQSGCFLFEVLKQHDIDFSVRATTEEGELLRPDHRLRSSETILLFRGHVGFGFAALPWGLHMDFVQQAASQLWRLAGSPSHVFIHGLAWTPDGWISHFGDDLLRPPCSHDMHLLCCLIDQHWSLCCAQVVGEVGKLGSFRVIFADGLCPQYAPAPIVNLLVTLEHLWILDCASLEVFSHLVQSMPHSCGTIMLGHIAHYLSILHPSLYSGLEDMHFSFALQSHLMQSWNFPLEGFGRSPAEEQLVLRKLETILKEKGVPIDRVEERALMGLRKIGTKELEDALGNQNPWFYLKAIASRPHVSFQWLRADELQSKIQARASTKFQIQKQKSKGGQRKTPSAPLRIDPDQLSLVPSTFFVKDQAVPQISFNEIAPGATGIAFCTVPDALPFLRDDKLVSDKPLGILTTSTIPNDQIGSMNVQQLRFPAQFKGTSEPVLLQGSLVNLGKSVITRGDSKQACQLDSVPTQTLRLYVYRDQWDGSWEDFVSQPVRSLLQKFPLLQLCRESGCGDACLMYHAAVDEPLDSLLLDLWARSWHKVDSKYTKPDQAAYWSVLVRVPASAQLTLQGLSGAHGFFVEPRSSSGKEVDEGYGMVWLGELSLQELSHKLKTTKNAVAIGRLRAKYGLRFRMENLEEAHKLLKPSDPFIGAKMQQIYRLYPLPFGTQRASLQKCLTNWGWVARVRQSVGGGDAGTAWEVGSSCAPPSPVMQLPDSQGDVTITLQKSVVKPSEPPALLASAATKKFLQGSSSSSQASSSDPWTHPSADPWGSYRPLTSSTVRNTDRLAQIEARLNTSLQDVRKEVTSTDPAVDLSSMESRLHQNLMESVRQELANSWPTRDQNMDSSQDFTFDSTTEDRLNTLESGMTELQAANQKFENWFNQ